MSDQLSDLHMNASAIALEEPPLAFPLEDGSVTAVQQEAGIVKTTTTTTTTRKEMLDAFEVKKSETLKQREIEAAAAVKESEAIAFEKARILKKTLEAEEQAKKVAESLAAKEADRKREEMIALQKKQTDAFEQQKMESLRRVSLEKEAQLAKAEAEAFAKLDLLKKVKEQEDAQKQRLEETKRAEEERLREEKLRRQCEQLAKFEEERRLKVGLLISMLNVNDLAYMNVLKSMSPLEKEIYLERRAHKLHGAVPDTPVNTPDEAEMSAIRLAVVEEEKIVTGEETEVITVEKTETTTIEEEVPPTPVEKDVIEQAVIQDVPRLSTPDNENGQAMFQLAETDGKAEPAFPVVIPSPPATPGAVTPPMADEEQPQNPPEIHSAVSPEALNSSVSEVNPEDSISQRGPGQDKVKSTSGISPRHSTLFSSENAQRQVAMGYETLNRHHRANDPVILPPPPETPPPTNLSPTETLPRVASSENLTSNSTAIRQDLSRLVDGFETSVDKDLPLLSFSEELDGVARRATLEKQKQEARHAYDERGQGSCAACAIL